MLDQLTESDFKASLGEAFILTFDSGDEVQLELICTGSLGARTEEQRYIEGREIRIRPDPFWLNFRGPHQPAIGQGNFCLRNARMGAFEHIFMVPSAEDAEGRIYHVVVN